MCCAMQSRIIYYFRKFEFSGKPWSGMTASALILVLVIIKIFLWFGLKLQQAKADHCANAQLS